MQSEKMIGVNEIILSGGHIFGLAFLGALQVLDLSKIKRYVGTSAGAIIGLFMVLGYTPERIIDIVTQIPLDNCLEVTSSDVLKFLDQFGAISTKKLIKFLEIFCKYANISSEVTFSELYNSKGIELVVIAYCVSDQISVEFCNTITPDMSVLKAIEMSIAVPIVFKPVLYNEKVYVDGAVIDNLPWRFARNKLTAIGITVRGKPRRKKMNVLDYISSLLEQCRYELDERTMLSYQDRICVIHLPVYKESWLLGHHPAEIRELIRIGRDTFFNFWESNGYN